MPSSPIPPGVETRELDALVAEKVMGYVWERFPEDGYSLMRVPGTNWCAVEHYDGEPPHYASLPDYSTDIAAAWLVVERMAELKPHPWAVTLMNWRYYGDRSYSATFRSPQLHAAPVEAHAESPAEAICRAALQALESR
jgi:hypothetical protein